MKPRTPPGTPRAGPTEAIDLSTGKPAAHAWAGGPVPLALSADGSRVLTRSRTADAYHVRPTPAVDAPFGPPLAGAALRLPVALSPDGTRFAGLGPDGCVRLMTVGSAAAPLELDCGPKPPAAVVFDPAGKLVAVAHDAAVVSLWDAATGEKRREMAGVTNPVTALAFGPGGAWLVGCSPKDRAVRMWNTATGRVRQTFAAPKPCIAVAASADGRHVAATSGWRPGYVGVWDAWTSELVLEWQPAVPAAQAVFAPDRRHLLVELYTGTVAVLRLAAARKN